MEDERAEQRQKTKRVIGTGIFFRPILKQAQVELFSTKQFSIQQSGINHSLRGDAQARVFQRQTKPTVLFKPQYKYSSIAADLVAAETSNLASLLPSFPSIFLIILLPPIPRFHPSLSAEHKPLPPLRAPTARIPLRLRHGQQPRPALALLPLGLALLLRQTRQQPRIRTLQRLGHALALGAPLRGRGAAAYRGLGDAVDGAEEDGGGLFLWLGEGGGLLAGGGSGGVFAAAGAGGRGASGGCGSGGLGLVETSGLQGTRILGPDLPDAAGGVEDGALVGRARWLGGHLLPLQVEEVDAVGHGLAEASHGFCSSGSGIGSGGSEWCV